MNCKSLLPFLFHPSVAQIRAPPQHRISYLWGDSEALVLLLRNMIIMYATTGTRASNDL